jgi:hypothetical protein
VADLGAIGVNGQLYVGPAVLSILRKINIGSVVTLNVGVRVDAVEGTPTPPCLAMDQTAQFRMLWPVKQGSRSITISVKQAVNQSPRPRITVKANPALGVNSDVSESAGSGTGWVTVGPLTVNTTGEGVLEVMLEPLYNASYAPCYWDNVITT